MNEFRDGKIRVLMAMDGYLPAIDGVINCMHNYCKYGNEKIEIVALAPRAGKFDDSTLPYKVFRCKSVHVPLLNYYYGMPKVDRKLKKYLEENHFDIIHFHSIFAMADFSLKYGKKYNIPVVSTFHTNFRPIFKKIFKVKSTTEACVRTVGKKYNKCHEIFTCSPLVAEQARSFGYTGKIEYLPFGTELEKPDNFEELRIQAEEHFKIDKDELVFLYVGRVVDLKRIDFTIDSLKILKDRGLKFKFFVVGCGMDLEKLKTRAQKLNLQDDIIFTGFLPRELMPAIYTRADLFLFPSLYDNFGLVKVEAACYNTPCILIESSCAGYGIVHNHNGYLSEDNINTFANEIEKAVKDKEKLKEVGINAGKELYLSWRDATYQLIDKYYEIIEEYKKVKK